MQSQQRMDIFKPDVETKLLGSVPHIVLAKKQEEYQNKVFKEREEQKNAKKEKDLKFIKDGKKENFAPNLP
jgi:hypothetical protein